MNKLVALLIMASAMAQTKPTQKPQAKQDHPAFMGVKFGVPLDKQFPACQGGFLPNNERCTDDGTFVRWKDEENRSIEVKMDAVGAVWFVSRDFPGDSRIEILDDLKAKYGIPSCDQSVSLQTIWSCVWTTSWGSVAFTWNPEADDGNNILITGATKEFYAKQHAAKEAATKRRRQDESF